MRSYFLILALAFVTLSCSTQVYLEPAVLESVVQKKEFKFNTDKAYPTSNQVVGIMNSTSPGGSSRLLNLSPGYGFVLNKDVFEVYLPYYGRAYNVQYGSNDGGIKFSSKDFTVTNQSNNKKGKTVLVIRPRDVSKDYVFNVEIFKNGSAFVSISSNDKQPISFDGNISTIPN